jgi:hypothetical protein
MGWTDENDRKVACFKYSCQLYIYIFLERKSLPNASRLFRPLSPNKKKEKEKGEGEERCTIRLNQVDSNLL